MNADDHSDKIYFPEDGFTKGDVVHYYERIATTILPYLKHRPESLNRHPDGINGQHFYQKNVTNELPTHIKTTPIVADSTGETVHYLVCDSAEALAYMAHLGCIEINPWHSKVEHLERPDYLIFDLDPGVRPFTDVVTVAQAFHALLDEIEVKSVPKTSGKHGLHIYVPLHAQYHYDDVRKTAHLICEVIAAQLPELTTLEHTVAARGDRIYLDYLRNAFGQNTAAVYSLRPVSGACVSTPLEWSEVRAGLDPKRFTIETIFRRLEMKGDLFAPILGKGVSLEKPLRMLKKLAV